MSFFYGVNSSSATNGNASSLSPFDKTILPGHNFKNPFMTAVIVFVLLTMVGLFAIAVMIRRIPAIGEPIEPGRKHIYKEHPAAGMGGICFWYLMLVETGALVGDWHD
jgi:hypothetical protein